VGEIKLLDVRSPLNSLDTWEAVTLFGEVRKVRTLELMRLIIGGEKVCYYEARAAGLRKTENWKWTRDDCITEKCAWHFPFSNFLPCQLESKEINSRKKSFLPFSLPISPLLSRPMQGFPKRRNHFPFILFFILLLCSRVTNRDYYVRQKFKDGRAKGTTRRGWQEVKVKKF